ncbi:MAG: glucose-1-phosphate thymidylyltransferase [Candidatus Tantalella remota]|nr:glucose-1-phosphate thymidylyltransferase [Candidatus Tantalella remota]
MLSPEDFFDLDKTPFNKLFDGVENVWEALSLLKSYIGKVIVPNIPPILTCGSPLVTTAVIHKGALVEGKFTASGAASKGQLRVTVNDKELDGASVIYAGAVLMDEGIQLGRGSIIESGAMIKGPAIIGDNTEVRQGAYIRGDVITGPGCVIGHATEVKSSVLLAGSKAGHFAYIGDSILGKVNLGAGTKLANLKILNEQVVLKVDGKRYETGLKKFGAILGDGVEMGCNSVTSPGTLLSRNVLVYPNSTVGGYHPANTIIKLRQQQDLQKRS